MLNKLLEYLRKKRQYKRYTITFNKCKHFKHNTPAEIALGAYEICTDYAIMDRVYQIQETSNVFENVERDESIQAFYILDSKLRDDGKCKIVVKCIPRYKSLMHIRILKELSGYIENVSIAGKRYM